MPRDAETRYYVEYDSPKGNLVRLSRPYGHLQAAMDDGRCNVPDGVPFRVVVMEPKIAAVLLGGDRSANCKFCGALKTVDRYGYCGGCIEGMARTGGD